MRAIHLTWGFYHFRMVRTNLKVCSCRDIFDLCWNFGFDTIHFVESRCFFFSLSCLSHSQLSLAFKFWWHHWSNITCYNFSNSNFRTGIFHRLHLTDLDSLHFSLKIWLSATVVSPRLASFPFAVSWVIPFSCSSISPSCKCWFQWMHFSYTHSLVTLTTHWVNSTDTITFHLLNSH